MKKFIVLYLLTFGLYAIYWFGRNWQFIRSRDNRNILPLGRALLSAFWYPALLSESRVSERPAVSFCD
jgi:hypothetical protein